MISNKRAFTLIELLVVVAMIGIITGAMTTSVRASQERARIQKAVNDVQVLAQAILAAENFNQNYELEAIGGTDLDGGVDAEAAEMKKWIGQDGTTASGEKVPALIMAALQGGGKMVDPWGTPYKIQIKAGEPIKIDSLAQGMTTGVVIPNYYRLSAEERK